VDEAGGLTLRVLGALDAIRDGAVVDLGGRRQRAALAALIIARGDVVSAESLAECVWGDEADARDAGGLHAYVSHLRRRIQPDAGARSRTDVIARVGRGYALRVGPLDVDAWQFEHALATATDQPASERIRLLGAALDLWRGPAYAEYADEPWVAAEVVRLTELRSVARERLMDARLALGDSPLLVSELEALVAEDPLREERWGLLVLALYRAHRQGDALMALRRARQTLAAELGVEPGPGLRSLERDVLGQSPALDQPFRLVPAESPIPTQSTTRQSRANGSTPLGRSNPLGPADPIGSADLARPVGLVDRDYEMSVLHRAVQDVCAGDGGTVLIEGSAGIGKTRLLTETGRLAAAAGVRVLSARASELERAYGFGTVRQLFEPSLLDPARRERLLDGAAAGARGVFDPVLDDERGDGSFAVLRGLYWLTVNLTADGPLLLSIDDVQWSDTASLRFLAYLVKRIERLPVLVALTVRAGERGPGDELLDELLLEPFATVLQPQGLSAAAAGTVVRERLAAADEAFIQTCHRTTSGNPLLLRQLVRALESEGVPPDVLHTDTVRAVGSRAVSNLVMLRLRRMPPAAVEAARAVALIGPAADLPAIAELAQLPEETAAEALDLLCRNEILADNRPLRFVHPLVQGAVYADLSTGDCALRHERAAKILHARGASVEAVAAHLLQAPARGAAQTVVILRSAAAAAAGRGASDSAVTFLRRALEEPAAGRDRIEALVELGRVEALIDGDAAVAHLTAAYAELTDPADAAERAGLALLIARTQAFAAKRGAATAFARTAAAALPVGHDDANQGLQAIARVAGYMHALPPADYRAAAPPQVDGDGEGARMLAATLSFERMLDGADRAGAVELARFALADDRLLDTGDMLLWVVAVDVLLVADAPEAAADGELWRRARTRAHATGNLFAVLAVNLWQGFVQWQQGRLDDALQSVGDATEQVRAWGGPKVGDPFAAAFLAGIQLDRGDVAAAARTVAAARTLPRIGEGARQLRHVTARLHLAQGRPEAALDVLNTDVGQFDITNPAWAPWRHPAARALAALGRIDEALRLADEQVELARRWGASSSLGPALRLAGELRGPDGVSLLRQAVDLLAPTRAALQVAKARLALGRRPELDSAEALPLLRAAAAGARDCGAQALVAAATVALSDRGESVVDPDALRPRLTVRERQVLDLTAAGLDLHQVAQRLFLTPGTVHEVLAAATAKTRDVDDALK
jgi:DNA-binding SARP family transcriptional activator/DNA-binding CsgD family transcriptional regulator